MAIWRQRQRCESSYQKPSNPRKHKKLEGPREDSPLEPSEKAWPCQHLDFGLNGCQNHEPVNLRFLVWGILLHSSPEKLIQMVSGLSEKETRRHHSIQHWTKLLLVRIWGLLLHFGSGFSPVRGGSLTNLHSRSNSASYRGNYFRLQFSF